jgi:hypothetical protein
MLKRTGIALLLLFGAVCIANSQDDAGRLLNLVDGLLNTAEGRLAAPADSPAAESIAFSVVNNTGFTIRNIFVCKSGDDNWGDNMLATPLLHGQRVTLTVNQPSDGTSQFNIRLIDVDGDRYTRLNVNLRARSTVRIGIGDFDF